MNKDKTIVHDFWEDASCGEALYLKGWSKNDYFEHSRMRYELEPYIIDFAAFDQYKGKNVLEIGVGLGAEHQKFAEAGAILNGIDLTNRAISHTRQRFEHFDLTSQMETGDAENLPFNDESFDLVYSWGVLHHTPDTAKAIDEVYRVLKPGGEAKVMIYHKYSLVGYMLWIKYAFLRLKPLTSLKEIYCKYLESPGTKAYSVEEGRNLFNRFAAVDISTLLSHGDLLSSSAGQRHSGLMLSVARLIWPSRIISKLFRRHGLIMMIKATK